MRNDKKSSTSRTFLLFFITCFLTLAINSFKGRSNMQAGPIWCNPPTFGTLYDFGVGLLPYHIAVADVNKDGNLDLVTASSNNQTVSVLIGNGQGSFQTFATYGTGGGASLCVAVADINLDSNPDLALANSYGVSGNISVFWGNGDGTFQTPSTYTAGSDPRFIASADLNSDGNPDLVVTDFNGGQIWTLLGNGNGSFQSSVYSVPPLPTCIVIGDLNNDGSLDLAVSNASLSIQGDSGGGVPQCGGEGIGGGDPTPIAEQAMVQTTSPYTNTSVFLGNGAGAFAAISGFGQSGVPATAILGDFNSDGKLDIAEGIGGEPNIFVALGNGDGTFQTPVFYSSGLCPHSIATADFNGDGIRDLVTANQGSKNISVLLGNGNGTFQTPLNVFTGKQPDSTAVGDFNRDGKPDLATTHIDRNNLAINGVAVLLNVDEVGPIISTASANPSVLMPVNHQMVPVTINYVSSDNCTAAASINCNLLVSSNEPIIGTGPGDKSPDWEIIDAHHVRLRAERGRSGNGRIYTVTVRCSDSQGNVSSQSVLVTVP